MANLPNLSFQPYIQAPDLADAQDYSNLLQTTNQRYDENIAKSDALDEHIAQLGTTINPVDQPILDSLNSDTRAALTNIKKNGDWENANVPIRMVAKRLLSDPAITVAQQNKAASDKIDALKEQAQAEGHQIIQFQDYRNTPTQNPDGSFNRITGDGAFDKKLDYMSKQKSIFDGLEANSTSSKDSSPQRDETTGQIYQIGSGSSTRYINKARIAAVVDNNLDNYLGTDEGQQQMKVLTTNNSENSNPVDASTAKQLIRTQLMQTGLTRTFHDSSSEQSEKLAPGKTATPADNTTLTQDTAVQQNQNLGDVIDALDNKARTPIHTGRDQLTPNYAPNFAIQGAPKKGFGDIPDNFKDTYNSLFDVYSKGLGTKDPNIVNPKIQAYLKGVQDGKISPTVHSYTDPKQISAANDFIRNGNLDGVPFYDPQTNKVLSLQQIKDGYKNEEGKAISDKDLSDAKVSGYYDSNNPFAELANNDAFVSSQKVHIGGHNFVVGAQPQVTKSPAYIGDYLGNKITRAQRTGLPATFVNSTTSDKIKVYSKPDGTYVLQGKTNDGKDIPPTALTLDQMKQALYASGYTTAQ